MSESALLVLEDGTIFSGRSFGAPGTTVGEVVFNTAMTGYQEILSDPSYARQVVTLTYPHIGNVGVNAQDVESRAIFAAGLIIRDLPRQVSNYRSESDLSQYLMDNSIVGICDIDTRKLTRRLREKGAMRGCIDARPDPDATDALRAAKAFPGLKGMDLAREVSVQEAYEWGDGVWTPDGFRSPAPEPPYHVVAYDFGVKRNILRLLVDRGCRLTVVPATTPARDAMALRPDGIFLSNGPGDPEPCDYAITAIREILNATVPVFGICLGHQLLALAAGAKTVKMKTGHHGANHPVLDLDTERVFITSQNHGFTVDAAALPPTVKVTHRSLFDQTIQGIALTDSPAFSFQGHPEASPGPHDIHPLFDRFIDMMKSNPGNQNATG